MSPVFSFEACGQNDRERNAKNHRLDARNRPFVSLKEWLQLCLYFFGNTWWPDNLDLFWRHLKTVYMLLHWSIYAVTHAKKREDEGTDISYMQYHAIIKGTFIGNHWASHGTATCSKRHQIPRGTKIDDSRIRQKTWLSTKKSRSNIMSGLLPTPPKKWGNRLENGQISPTLKSSLHPSPEAGGCIPFSFGTKGSCGFPCTVTHAQIKYQ